MNLIAAVADLTFGANRSGCEWMSDPQAPDYLDRQGSYGLLSITVGSAPAVGLLYLLYVMGGFGSPEIGNFRDQCRQREVQATAHLATRPDYDQIILKCERELREFLRRR
jgi:hypothetical protein